MNGQQVVGLARSVVHRFSDDRLKDSFVAYRAKTEGHFTATRETEDMEKMRVGFGHVIVLVALAEEIKSRNIDGGLFTEKWFSAGIEIRDDIVQKFVKTEGDRL